MSRVSVITSAASKKFSSLVIIHIQAHWDDPDNAKAVINIVRKLILNCEKNRIETKFL
ncbi:MAG: hypothetical protein ACR5KW_01965 [Wolbachia sp.]